MKQKLLFKAFISASIMTLGTLGVCQMSYADQDTQNLIAGYGTSQSSQQALVAAPSDTLVGPEGWAQALYTPTPTNPLTITQTQQALATYFAVNQNATSSSALADNIINNTATFGPSNAPIPSTSSLYAGCANNAVFQGGSGLTNCLNNQQNQAFANVDLDSLIAPLVYQSNQSQAASSFIKALATLNSPMPILDLNKYASANKTTVSALVNNNNDVIQYLADLRAYAATQAVGLSNLNQMYAERQPTNVSQSSNPQLYQALNAIGMPNASQLQVENYMATRRITNQGWVASLSNDGPAALMRQMVILLAENLTESYNNHMALERLNATMTALELEQAAALRTAVQNDINTVRTSAPGSSNQ